MAKRGGTVEGPADLKRLEARLAKVARRSPWAAYVMRNFDALAEMIKNYGAHWDEISRWAVEEGHTNGQPLRADAARKVFERERARLARLAQPAPVTSVKPASAKPAAGSVRILPKEEPATDVDQKLAAFRETLKKGG